MDGVKEVPTGVKIISVLQFIGVGLIWISALLTLIGGIVLLASGPAALLRQGVPIEYYPILSSLGGAVFIILSVFFAGLGVLFFFIARGLWRLKNWARITTIVLQTLAIIYYLYTIITGAGGYVNIIISIVIVSYLVFSKKVKLAFKK